MFRDTEQFGKSVAARLFLPFAKELSGMIVDISGIEITPGNGGENCRGNGTYSDEQGRLIECCCEECDYASCCASTDFPRICVGCEDMLCPNASPPSGNS